MPKECKTKALEAVERGGSAAVRVRGRQRVTQKCGPGYPQGLKQPPDTLALLPNMGDGTSIASFVHVAHSTLN